VNFALLLSDGRHVVTGSEDNTARLWDLAVGAPALLLKEPSTVHSADISWDAARIVTTRTGGLSARLWDGNTGALISELSEHTKPLTLAMSSPDGNNADGG